MKETLEVFIANQAKCHWEPSQVQGWLGYCIDLAKGRITIPVEKINNLKLFLARAEKKKFLTASEIESIVEKIISMSLGVGAIAKLKTTSIYRLLECWYTRLSLKGAREEIQFW